MVPFHSEISMFLETAQFNKSRAGAGKRISSSFGLGTVMLLRVLCQPEDLPHVQQLLGWVLAHRV